MSFTITSWFIVTLLGICACIVVASIASYETRKKARVSTLAFIISFVIGSGLYSAVSYTVGSADFILNDQSNLRWATYSEVARDTFGFEPGQSYKLVLGSQVSTFSGSAEAGFFWASTDFNGGPAVTVSYKHDDKTYTLSLPRDATIIHTVNSGDPTVVVRFKPDTTYGHPDAYYVKHWSGCKTVISNLAFACQRTATLDTKPTVSNDILQAGLGTLVKDRFASAEITMPEDMYNTLIGKIS